MLLIIVVVLCARVCLSRQNVCTDVNRFPQLNNNYTVIGLPVKTITVGGMLGCVRECQMLATCKAFTYKKTRNCSMYAQFEFSSPNNIDVSDVTSIISDWNTVQVCHVKITSLSIQQDVFRNLKLSCFLDYSLNKGNDFSDKKWPIVCFPLE